MNEIIDFLEPLPEARSERENLAPLQICNRIHLLNNENSDWTTADVVILGCDHNQNQENNWSNSPNAVRESLFKMYDWHPSIKVTDLGNIRKGASPSDTQAALKAVLKEIEAAGKIVVLLGGNQNQMIQQYEVFEQAEKLIEGAVLDRFIDLDDSEGLTEQNFLMSLLTRQPNFIRHFNLLGFQSYDVNPNVLETLDKLRFDCVRLGRVQENLEEIEPTLRSCNMLGIDLQVLRASEAPFLKNASPNGLFGNEICQLTRYAGMSQHLTSFGIFNYNSKEDFSRIGAQLVAQMIWYFIDGLRIRKQEDALENKDSFNTYHVPIAEVDTLFLKSKRTGRWWMKLPDKSFLPCSYNDYLIAGNGKDIPERWLRAQERIT